MLGRPCARLLRPAQPYVCLPWRHAPTVARLSVFTAARSARSHSAEASRHTPEPAPISHDPETAEPAPAAAETDPSTLCEIKLQRQNERRLARVEGRKRRKLAERAALKNQQTASERGETRADVQSNPDVSAQGPPETEASADERQVERNSGQERELKQEAVESNDGFDIGNKQTTSEHVLAKTSTIPIRVCKSKARNRNGRRKKKAIKNNIDLTRAVHQEPNESGRATAEEVFAEAAKRALPHTISSAKGHQTLESVLRKAKVSAKRSKTFLPTNSVSCQDVQLTPIEIEQRPVRPLRYGLDRVLFNPGVYHLQDPRSQVYNFDPYLQKIMPVDDFNFNSLGSYVTSSKDQALAQVARQLNKKYVGSTSSMTAVLSHFHFLLSCWRPLNLQMLSKGFSEQFVSFTKLNRLPSAVFLRWKDGTYAIDADKQYDTANVLSKLGQSMEKLLTLPTEEYERYRKGSSNQISEEERNIPESYHYTTQGDILMRSQLDARDSRLPGTGMFDLKTRAVVSIRMDISEWEEGMGYQIKTDMGKWESFEREYYDMMRSTMLKYSLQARMGRMDGIFVAYHNIERIFGFQYISIEEMDQVLHSPKNMDRHLGDLEFKLSVDLLNKALNMATEKFPETSMRLHFETRESSEPFMYIFAEPMAEEEIQTIQDTNKASIEAWERGILGLDGEKGKDSLDDQHGATYQFVDAVHMPKLFRIQDEKPKPAPLMPHALTEVHESSTLSDQQKEADGEPLPESTESSTTDETSDKPRPLLGLKLHIRNKVNGKYVERPKDVTPTTDWTVEYNFIELSAPEAGRRYASCKQRRHALFKDPASKEDEDQVEEEKAVDYYQRMLKEISQRGREWRQTMDVAQSEKGQVVFQPGENWALGKMEGGGEMQTELRQVNGVESYLKWLYKRQVVAEEKGKKEENEEGERVSMEEGEREEEEKSEADEKE